jgi:site-specific DNA-methyltransferase (adenine-specific)
VTTNPVIIGDCTLYLGDCLEIMQGMDNKSVDAVITDPPYPDYYAEKYKYQDGILNPLKSFDCRQFIFWTAKQKFPLDYTAVHIWDKKTGCGSEYEKIYERNGNKNYKVFRYYLINSTVAASFTGDIFTGHPSQKPIKLITKIIIDYIDEFRIVLDPFMGSGTTGVACVQTGREFIGIEIDPGYFEIACKRIRDANQQMRLPLH